MYVWEGTFLDGVPSKSRTSNALSGRYGFSLAFLDVVLISVPPSS